MLILPLLNNKNYRYSIKLNDIKYNIVLKWNVRCMFWTLSVYDELMNPLAIGERCVPNQLMFFWNKIDIPGNFFFYYPEEISEFSYDDFANGIAKFYYLEPDDFSKDEIDMTNKSYVVYVQQTGENYDNYVYPTYLGHHSVSAGASYTINLYKTNAGVHVIINGGERIDVEDGSYTLSNVLENKTVLVEFSY